MPPSLPSPEPLRTQGAAGNTINPGTRPLLTLLDPPSLPQRPSSPTLCGRALPAPGTASSRTHPGLPHLLAGGDLLPHLAPAPRWELGLGYPPPAPPAHRYPFPTPASLSYLGLAQRSHPSLTSSPRSLCQRGDSTWQNPQMDQLPHWEGFAWTISHTSAKKTGSPARR